MLTKDFDYTLDLGKLSGAEDDLEEILEQCTTGGGREPPMMPGDFVEALKAKSFTNGKADRRMVGGLYGAAFETQMGKAIQLDYGGLEWGDAEMMLITKVASSGAMAKLERLYLRDNKVEDAGMSSFSDAIAAGALSNLTVLTLDENKIGDVGMTAFAKAIVTGGGMANLEQLGLGGNQIGDAGMRSLSDAVALGVLANLQKLILSGNKIGDAGMASLSHAIAQQGALAKCRKIYLSKNGGSDAPVQSALAERT